MRASVIHPSAASTVFRCLSCLRLPEILVLQGAPLVGVAFAMSAPMAGQVTSIVTLVAANICLVAHVFLLNDWSGLSTDREDPNKAAGVFTNRGVDSTQIGALVVILLMVSLLLFSSLGVVTLGLAIAIAILSALYSLPAFDWKARVILNSGSHLAGGALHFLLGCSVVSALDGRSLATAAFFGVTFAAGHLTQEVRDYEGDVRNGIETNAVTFGPRPTFAASVVLFTLAYAVLLLLALQSIIPRPLAALVVLYPLHLRWSLEALRDGLTYAAIDRLRARYRVLYAVIGLAIVAALR